MTDAPPTAIIIPFVLRRARPRVCVAIRGEMTIDGDILGRFGFVPANDQPVLPEGGSS